MKTSAILLLFACTFLSITTFAQSFKGPNYITVGGATSPFFSSFFNPSAIMQRNVTMSFEHRFAGLNRVFGLGLAGNYIQSDLINTGNPTITNELNIGPRLYAHAFNTDRFDLYAAVGVSYAKQTMAGNINEATAFKYAWGLRIALANRYFVGGEMSNFRYNSGVFPSLNVGVSF